MYQTLKQAGYKYIQRSGNRQHTLENTETGIYEVWYVNKNHANFGLIFKNTHLEFGYSLKPKVIKIA